MGFLANLIHLPPSNSTGGSVNALDLWKTLRGGCIIIVGYILSTVLTQLLQDVSSGVIDLGQFSMAQGLLVTILSSALELVRRKYTSYPPS